MNFRFLCEVSSNVAATLITLRSILLILAGISAIVIIVSVLCQPSNPDGGRNVITGTNDSYYMQHKGGNREGRLKKIIIACAIVIFVATLIYFISFGIYTGFTQ